MHAGHHPLILGVVVTDRPLEFRRLLESLVPVAMDPHLHIVALNNCGAGGIMPHATSVDVLMEAEQRRCSGLRLVVSVPGAPLPLHASRRALCLAIDALCVGPLADASTWMLDDDLTFEELVLANGRVRCRNVARRRIASARELLSWQREVEVFVSGFTGDPPVRPEAVLAGQLTDLAEGLRQAGSLPAGAPWPVFAQDARTQDDYYDHSEGSSLETLLKPRPWVPRGRSRGSVRVQRRRMLAAAAGISRGCTPFRPLLAAAKAPIRRVAWANGGGNTLYRHTRVLCAHPYPAWPVGSGHTRRADMVGLAWLVRQHRISLAEAPLTLRHDRSLQPPVQPDTARWVPEFAGVLLCRAYHASAREQVDGSWVRIRVGQRLERILGGLRRARQAARSVLAGLDRTRLHGQSRVDTDLMEATAAMTTDVAKTVEAMLDGQLEAALRNEEIVETILTGLSALARGGAS